MTAALAQSLLLITSAMLALTIIFIAEINRVPGSIAGQKCNWELEVGMSRARARLSPREIWLLLHLLDRSGLSGRMTLPVKRRDGVAPLWRRHLVEIWYRCAPDEGVARGPYFNLTADGFQMACALRAGRDEYRKSHPGQFNRSPRRAA